MFGQVPVSPAEPFLPDLMAAGLPLPGGMMQGHGSGRPQGGLGEVTRLRSTCSVRMKSGLVTHRVHLWTSGRIVSLKFWAGLST